MWDIFLAFCGLLFYIFLERHTVDCIVSPPPCLGRGGALSARADDNKHANNEGTAVGRARRHQRYANRSLRALLTRAPRSRILAVYLEVAVGQLQPSTIKRCANLMRAIQTAAAAAVLTGL